MYICITTLYLQHSIELNQFNYLSGTNCPVGFVVHQKSSYYMDNLSTSSWRAAGILCQNLGADLVVIKMDSVQSSSNYLQKLFTKNLLTAR